MERGGREGAEQGPGGREGSAARQHCTISPHIPFQTSNPLHPTPQTPPGSFSTFSGTVLALSFVFGNSVRAVFEAMIFLFIEHAFDVGDIIVVEGESFVVKARARRAGKGGAGRGARGFMPATCSHPSNVSEP